MSFSFCGIYFIGPLSRHVKRTRLSRRFNAPHQFSKKIIDGSTGKTHRQERNISADSTAFFHFSRIFPVHARFSAQARIMP